MGRDTREEGIPTARQVIDQVESLATRKRGGACLAENQALYLINMSTKSIKTVKMMPLVCFYKTIR